LAYEPSKPPTCRHRLERQAVVTGDNPIPYTGTIHEAALRMQLGGPKVARSQLTHLLEASDRDNVTFLVIPFTAGGFPMIGESILYAQSASPHLDTVHMDSPAGAVFFDSPTQLARFRAMLDFIESVALVPEKSRDFIHTIINEL
jgi:Domain of unknown function (DUF5753)